MTSLGNIFKSSNAQTRSISAENVYGEKGAGGMAENSDTHQESVVKIGQHWNGASQHSHGRGWKIRPAITLPAGITTTIMDVDGPAIIQHVWFTLSEKSYRAVIIRMYWDGEDVPSVEAPIGDFFCNGWNTRTNILALPINVNPSGGFNCFFPMPFRKHAKITVENRTNEKVCLFYTINYSLTPVQDDDTYFHAQFRRVNPLPYKEDYIILDGVKGHGLYVGTYLAWQQKSQGWWGEGEFKAFIDGDTDFPTICGTGTEDYFGGAWGFGETFSAPFLGYPLGISDLTAGNRHVLYRFHIMDPIRFEKDLKITIQALGQSINADGFSMLQEDIASVAYWYQNEPHVLFPELPGREQMAVSRPSWQSEFIKNWYVSELLPKNESVEFAPAVALEDPLGWKPIKASDSGFVDIHSLYKMANGIVYLATTIKVSKDACWILSVGTDSGIRVFIDAIPVLTQANGVNPASPDELKATVKLSKGEHAILVALDTRNGLGYGIFVRFEQSSAGRITETKPEFPAGYIEEFK